MRRRWARGGVLAGLGGIVAVVTGVGSMPLLSPGSVVVFLGLASLVAGVLTVRSRLFFTPRSHANLPIVEHGARAPVPGDGFDAILDDIDAGGDFGGSAQETDRDYVRSVLYNAVVTTLVIDAGMDESAAERTVDRGTWTSDRLVASFLADDVDRPPIAERVGVAVGREPPTRQVVRRTIDDLERIRGDRRE